MSLFTNKIEKQEEVHHDARNIIGKTTVITGDLETSGNIRIDGKLIGNIRSKSKVSLGPGSKVEGTIQSLNAEIEGEVIGRLEIAEILILKPTAVVHGDIFTGKLIVETGASFNGNCSMGEIAKKNDNPLTVNAKAPIPVPEQREKQKAPTAP
jgi:cytoskeletal protein CcmA (bactofilin family)